MPEDDKLGALDRAVELLARALNALGLNGTRLQWKWNQRRRRLGEAGFKTEILWRSARGQHKMCRSCRALVGRSERVCPECGASMSRVQAPGIGRALSNLLPGVSAATSILMLVNGFWFLLMIMAQIKSGSSGGGSVSLFGGFDWELIIRFGSGLSRPMVLSTGEVTGGEWWRVITPIFLHGGMIHFLFNSYLLLNLGPVAEEIYTTPRFWSIYLICGIGGSALTQLQPINTVGASGAIMGLIGLLLVRGYRGGGLLGQSMKSLLIRLLIYSVVLSFMFHIDHVNHIGGFVCGAALGWFVPHGEFRSPAERVFWQVLSLAGVLLVLLAFFQVAAFSRTVAES